MKETKLLRAMDAVEDRYLLEAEEGEGLHIKEDENSGVAWFLPGDAVLASTEPWMRERVYRKLNEKINRNERINL